MHGNLSGYFRGLERKIGRQRLDELDALPKSHTWTREELEDIRTQYREKIKQLESSVAPEGNHGVAVLDMFSDL